MNSQPDMPNQVYKGIKATTIMGGIYPVYSLWVKYPASRATVVRDAWAAGRELTVSGLVSDRRNIPLADFQIRVGAEDSAREKCAAAIADFERLWKLRP